MSICKYIVLGGRECTMAFSFNISLIWEGLRVLSCDLLCHTALQAGPSVHQTGSHSQEFPLISYSSHLIPPASFIITSNDPWHAFGNLLRDNQVVALETSSAQIKKKWVIKASDVFADQRPGRESTLCFRLLIRRERAFLVSAVRRQSQDFSLSIVKPGLEPEPAALSASLSSFPGVLYAAPIFYSLRHFLAQTMPNTLHPCRPQLSCSYPSNHSLPKG